jgi:hypothetical protein
MTREEKILTAIDKGITCNPITGEVFGIRGGIISNVKDGYIRIGFFDKKRYYIYAHQFIYYCIYKKCVEQIDHINGIRHDNRIENLRSVTNQQNCFNRKPKGCSYHKRDKNWRSSIMIDGQNVFLGCFKTEQEAHEIYLEAKKIHHQI